MLLTLFLQPSMQFLTAYSAHLNVISLETITEFQMHFQLLNPFKKTQSTAVTSYKNFDADEILNKNCYRIKEHMKHKMHF